MPKSPGKLSNIFTVIPLTLFVGTNLININNNIHYRALVSLAYFEMKTSSYQSFRLKDLLVNDGYLCGIRAY